MGQRAAKPVKRNSDRMIALLCLIPLLGESPNQEAAAWHLEGCHASTAYIGHLDQGNYQEGWRLCDSIFQRAISQDEWISDLKLLRKDHGGILSRTLIGQRMIWNPQDFPSGPYILIEYHSTSRQYPQLKELLTLRMGDDNKWRVLVYQLQYNNEI